MNNWKESTQFNTPKELYDYLLANQHEEELVFSHGDYCLPNVFLECLKIKPDYEKINYYSLLNELYK
jgi:aminoglycoside phosphotransferase